MSEKKRAYCYLRVSSGKQAREGYSLENQEEKCLQFADKEGFLVEAIFRDEGISAKTRNRPALQKMYELALHNSRKIDGIICYDITRFSRNVNDYTTMDDELEKHGIRVFIVNGTNGDSPTQRDQRIQNVSAGQRENGEKANNVGDVQRSNLMKGIWPWKPPIGYKREKSTGERSCIVRNPKYDWLIKKAFELTASGNYTQRAICKILKTKGLDLSFQHLNKILGNPMYCGLLQSNKIAPGKTFTGLHDPIISEELFYKVQNMGRKKVGDYMKKLSRDKFSLTRFTMCPHCGRPFTAAEKTKKSGKQYQYYWCQGGGCQSHPEVKIDTDFHELLCKFRISEDVKTNLTAKIQANWEEDHQSLKHAVQRLEYQVRELKKKKQKLLDFLVSGTLDEDEFAGAKERIQSELIEKTEKLEQTKTAHDTSFSDFLAFIDTAMDNLTNLWKRAKSEQRRRLQDLLFPGGTEYDGKKFIAKSVSHMLEERQDQNIS